MGSLDLTEDKVTLLTEYGLDLDNRRIYLFEEIDHISAYNVILGLHLLGDSEEPIELHVGSPGGELSCMFQIYDAVQQCSSPVQTYGWGEVASAALLVLACGKHRYAHKHCWSMAHSATQSFIDADESTSVIRTKLFVEWADKYYSLLAKHTGKKSAEWRDAIKNSGEHWLDSSMMLEWGVVDEVLGGTGANKNKVRKSKGTNIPKIHRTKNKRRVRTRRRGRTVKNNGY